MFDPIPSRLSLERPRPRPLNASVGPAIGANRFLISEPSSPAMMHPAEDRNPEKKRRAVSLCATDSVGTIVVISGRQRYVVHSDCPSSLCD